MLFRLSWPSDQEESIWPGHGREKNPGGENDSSEGDESALEVSGESCWLPKRAVLPCFKGYNRTYVFNLYHIYVHIKDWWSIY